MGVSGYGVGKFTRCVECNHINVGTGNKEGHYQASNGKPRPCKQCMCTNFMAPQVQPKLSLVQLANSATAAPSSVGTGAEQPFGDVAVEAQ